MRVHLSADERYPVWILETHLVIPLDLAEEASVAQDCARHVYYIDFGFRLIGVLGREGLFHLAVSDRIVVLDSKELDVINLLVMSRGDLVLGGRSHC